MMGVVRGGLVAWACIVASGWAAQEKLGQAVLQGTNVVSLGTYPNTEDRTARVQIRNAGAGELRFEHVIGTCKCMRVDAYPRSLGPGETGEVAVSILKNEVSGAFRQVFFIETDDPGNRNIKVGIEGYAKPLFLVTCDAPTELGQVEAGQAWTGRYTVVATEAGVFLGSPLERNRGTRCVYTLTTNGMERAAYGVSRVVTFEGEGLLESELDFPILGEGKGGLMPVRLSVSAVRRARLRIAPDEVRVGVSATAVTRRLAISVSDALPPDAAQLSWRTPLEGVGVQARLSKSGKGLVAEVTFPAACTQRLRDAGRSELLFRYRNGSEVALEMSSIGP